MATRKPKRTTLKRTAAYALFALLGAGIVSAAYLAGGILKPTWTSAPGTPSPAMQLVSATREPAACSSTKDVQWLENRNNWLQDQLVSLLAASTTRDGRIIIPDNTFRFVFGEMSAVPTSSWPSETDWNTDAATQWVTYHNDAYGITIPLPFNPNWGDSRYAVTPYDEYADPKILMVNFGPLNYFECREGCGWPRGYTFSSMPAKSAEQIRLDLQKESENWLAPDISVSRINGIDLMKIQQIDEMFGVTTTHFIVIGKRSNYYIAGDPFAEPPESMIRSMVARMKIE